MIKKLLLQCIFLLGSGFIAAAGFVVLATGQFFNIDQVDNSSFLLIVSLLVFSLTAGVFGSDRQVLALSTGFQTRIRISNELILWNIFVSFFSFMYLLYSFHLAVYSALALSLSVALDAFAVIFQSWLSTQMRSGIVFLSNFLRYPLFFLIIYLFGLLFTVSIEFLCLLFSLSSIVRFLFLLQFVRKGSDFHVIHISMNKSIGLYQIINYVVFRGGQLVAGLPFFSLDKASLPGVILCWKVIELIDKSFVYLMPIIFNIYNKFSKKQFYFFLAILCSGACLVFFLFYFWSSPGTISSSLLLLFLFHVFFLLPVNLSVLIKYRNFQYRIVLISGLFSLIFTFFFTGIIYHFFSPEVVVVAWTPFSLIFLGLLLSIPLAHNRGAAV